MRRTSIVLWGLVLGLTVLWLSAAALAGDGPTKGTSGNSGSDSAGLEVLFRLAGRWEVEEQYPANEGEEEGPKGSGDMRLKKDLDKQYLIGTYGTKCKELNVDVKGHMVFSYDPDAGTDAYGWWWFDNYGHQYAFVGYATNNNRALVFEREDPSGDPDNPTIDRRTFTFRGEDEITYKWERGSGKALTEKMTATYTRKGSKSDAKDAKVAPKRVHKRGF